MSESLFYSSKFQCLFPELLMLESQRNGGFSLPPYKSLNLGLNTNDQLSKVQKNRASFFSAIHISEENVVGGLQVHGSEILKVDKPGYFEGYDAFITKQKNILLTIGMADCTPILIFDSKIKAVGAAHAGWRGTVAHIAQKTILKMHTEYDTQAADCFVFIGTCIDPKNFEVGEEVATHFDSDFIQYYPHSQKPHIDLKAANKQQLMALGVPENQIDVSPFSTVNDNDKYFSYRHENGTTGRMLAVIGVKDT